MAHVRPTIPQNIFDRQPAPPPEPMRPTVYEEHHEFKTPQGSVHFCVKGDPNVKEEEFNEQVNVTIGECVLNSSQVNRLVGSVLRATLLSMYSRGIQPPKPEALHPAMASDWIQRLQAKTIAQVAQDAFTTLLDDEGDMVAMFSLQWQFVPEALSAVIIPGKPQPKTIAVALPEIMQMRFGSIGT